MRMKWCLTVIQDMSSMILVALKQVEHQSWMLSRASYSTGQKQSVWGNSYMQYGEWLSNDIQMYLNTVCLGTAFQWMVKQGQLQVQRLVSLMSVGLAEVGRIVW